MTLPAARAIRSPRRKARLDYLIAHPELLEADQKTIVQAFKAAGLVTPGCHHSSVVTSAYVAWAKHALGYPIA
jgi:hypothetical protein